MKYQKRKIGSYILYYNLQKRRVKSYDSVIPKPFDGQAVVRG